MTLFPPWGTYLERKMTDTKLSNVSGFDMLSGGFPATFLIGSPLVSLIESLLHRRAAFVHVGFFAASLPLAVLFHLMPIIPRFNLVETGFGFNLHLLSATLVSAITGVPSPASEPQRTGRGKERTTSFSFSRSFCFPFAGR